jgi:hypothetical protein
MVRVNIWATFYGSIKNDESIQHKKTGVDVNDSTHHPDFQLCDYNKRQRFWRNALAIHAITSINGH